MVKYNQKTPKNTIVNYVMLYVTN